MQKEKNEILNNVDSKTKSYICQKKIIDKAKNLTSEFIVLSSHDFKKQDWVIKPKFLEISDLLGTTPLDYPLKTAQGNPDEGQKPIDGKALRITVEKELVIVAVYTKSYGKTWSPSHTHQIAKNVFDAYVVIVENDKNVLELEKESKAPKNFSLNLG